MKRLTVLYDASCAFCVRCRRWLLAQPQLLELDFVAARSPEAARRFPEIEHEAETDELLVVSDEGGVYRGARAWIMCLYALAEYREWSLRLARPALLPFARRAFEATSRNRRRLTRLLRLGSDEQVASTLAGAAEAACRGTARGLTPSCTASGPRAAR